jgi:hypothetical protein
MRWDLRQQKYLLNLKLWGIKYEFQDIISNSSQRWMKKEHVFFMLSVYHCCNPC